MTQTGLRGVRLEVEHSETSEVRNGLRNTLAYRR